jgi:hypothetical protein
MPGRLGPFSLDTARSSGVSHVRMSVPDELTSSIALLRMPDVPSVAEFMRNTFVVHVRIAYVGPSQEGDRLVMPLRQSAAVLLDTVGDMPLADLASIHNDPVDPMLFREWTAMLAEFTGGTVDSILELAGPQARCPLEFVELRQLGGALGRQIGPPNAVGNREAAFAVWVMSMGEPSVGDPESAYAERMLADLQPWSTGRTFLNFISTADTARERVPRAYSPRTYARLRELKAAYDPENVSRLNHNIPPSGVA